MFFFSHANWSVIEELTSAITSRVAKARISAHETLFLHWGMASTAAFALITVSNPSPAKDRLSGWSFSAWLFPVDAIKTEASQPFNTAHTKKLEHWSVQQEIINKAFKNCLRLQFQSQCLDFYTFCHQSWLQYYKKNKIN